MGTYVKPEGDPYSCKFALVGEQPGKTEIASGRPFCGAAGIELNKCLMTIGISRTDCYITNFAKDLDKHVSEYLNLKTNTYSQVGLEYRKILLKELQHVSAKVIIALGNYAFTAITGINEKGITEWRGSILELPEFPGKWIIPMLHPATLLPHWDVQLKKQTEGRYLNKFLIELDLKKAKGIVDNGGFKRKERDLQIKPSYDGVLGWLSTIQVKGHLGDIVYYDIEIYNEELSCISFALLDSQAISIPFVDWNGDYFTPEQELRIIQLIGEILEDPTIKKCGQNVSFDSHFLLRRYGIKSTNMEDTMIAQHTILPDFRKGLDFITSIYTDQPYYKEEGKKYFSGGGWEQLWKYNATDSLMCAESLPKQKVKIKEQHNEKVFAEKCKLIEPIIYMQERGIKVDLEGMIKRSEQLGIEIEELQEKLNSTAGQELNANSPKQLKEYFYGKLKFREYKKQGSITTDFDAMKRIARQGNKEAQLILDIRRRKKLKGTYLPLHKIDPDGRLRCSFNPVGTRYSRISSSENIFGTGMNMQNWPHELHKFLLFDDDYIGYRMDLSQGENRIVAYEGNVTPMIECFERGDDVHKLTAGLILGKNPSEISSSPGSCFLGDGTHSEREWGKKGNHSLNYDFGYKSFAIKYEMMEKQAAFLVNSYHRAYPQIRSNYHANIKRDLRERRSLINLMGRTTLFLDKWGDNLFKEAFSCIPQGTIGDIMDQRGLNYVYFNKEFAPVEILLQVHDDMTFQIPRSIPLRIHAQLLLNIYSSLTIPLKTSYGREFVIPADLVICKHTFSKEENKEIKSHKIPNSPELLEKLLHEMVN